MQPQHEIIRDRLRREMNQRGLSAVELAKSAGVKTSFLYDILNGKSTNPSTVKLAQVAESLGLNLAYLAGVSDSAEPPASSQSVAVDIAAIPRIKVDASAGGGTIVQEEREGEAYFFRRTWIRENLGVPPEQLRMLFVTGDSMEPTLHDRDIIMVDTSKTSPSPAGIFVLFDGYGLVVKRLEYVSHRKQGEVGINVISDNPQYGKYESPLADIRIIGRVVWYARKL